MKGLSPFARSEAAITGTQIVVSVPGKGRFIFSSQPEPGFRMEAIADGTRLLFVVGSELYDIQCSAPIVTASGSWYLWVRHEPTPQGRIDLPNVDLSIQ